MPEEQTETFFDKFLQKIEDAFKAAKEAIISWWRDLWPSQETGSENSSQNYEPQPNYAPQSQEVYKNCGVSHIFDFIASACLFFAVIIALKPLLLSDLAIKDSLERLSQNNFIDKINYIGAHFFEFAKNVFAEIIVWRNFFVVFGILFFIVFKLIAIFASKSPVKIVSILLLALSILTCVFVKEKFLLFLIYMVLLYFIFEFSCGFNFKTVYRKFISMIVLFIIEYFAIHFIFVKGLLEQFAIKGLSLWS